MVGTNVADSAPIRVVTAVAGLCEAGILALPTGVTDPGYSRTAICSARSENQSTVAGLWEAGLSLWYADN